MPDDPAFVWDSRSEPLRPSPRPDAGTARPPRGEAPAPAPSPQASVRSSGPDRADAILVPLDEWSRIIGQLGNLHEAGRELAEARERAARAETEALFLRERLRELRERLDAATAEQRREEEAQAAAEEEPPPAPTFAEWALGRWLARRGRHRGWWRGGT